MPVTIEYAMIGEIGIFPSEKIPQGWMPCDGQILPVGQYQALASLLGATYGGDGTTTFALPDLRGRAECVNNIETRSLKI
jgi:microcystin-dependent protein